MFTLVFSSVEQKVKGMFVGKISSLITWPSGKSSSKFVIGVYGKNGISNELKKIYAKKKIKRKTVKIISSTNISDLKSSDIIYIAKASSSQIKEVVKFATANNILTISDVKGFVDKEGIIQLFTVSKKVKIKVNNTIAKKSNLKIKSILLKLAKDVK